MTDDMPVRPRSGLAFAGGLIIFAWIALAVLWTPAIFLTWWGDCFSEPCPAPSDIDRALYLLDPIAWASVGLVSILAFLTRWRALFLVVAAIGLAFAIQGVGGFVGVRGLYAFGLLLPASVLLCLGGVVGARSVSGRAPAWATGSAISAVGLGCSTYFVAYFGFFGAVVALNGQVVGLLLVALVVAAILIVFVLVRRQR